MIAEIKGKISRTASNLTDRLEDQLTGNFFGSLRYLPFNKALKPLLINTINEPQIVKAIDKLSCEYWATKIEFWPYDVAGELDVVLEFDEIVIGIEVKYKSGLSSDDDIKIDSEINEIQNSKNQLLRESNILIKKYPSKRKVLLLIGDALSCTDIYADVMNRGLFENNDVLFGYATWQTLLSELKKIICDNAYDRVLIDDIIKLLIRKGFVQFKDMMLHLDLKIDKNKYFEFSIEEEMLFNFNTALQIEGDLYYEFT